MYKSLNHFLCLILFLNYFCITNGQRVAPGVPPQRYQPPTNNINNAQQQQVYQQQGYQQQQVYQQQVYGGDPPVGSGNPQVETVEQYAPPPSNNNPPPSQVQPRSGASQGKQYNYENLEQPVVVLDTSNLEAEREAPIDTSKMSENELIFHYFKMNDLDNDGKLDGLELVKSIFHSQLQHHGHEEEGKNEPPKPIKIFTDEELSQIVDHIMDKNDNNKDGIIDYAEFSIVQSQQTRRRGTL